MMSVSKRMLIVTVCYILGLALLVAVAVVTLRAITGSYDSLKSEALPKQMSLQQLQHDFADAEKQILAVLSSQDAAVIEQNALALQAFFSHQHVGDGAIQAAIEALQQQYLAASDAVSRWQAGAAAGVKALKDSQQAMNTLLLACAELQQQLKPSSPDPVHVPAHHAVEQELALAMAHMLTASPDQREAQLKLIKELKGLSAEVAAARDAWLTALQARWQAPAVQAEDALPAAESTVEGGDPAVAENSEDQPQDKDGQADGIAAAGTADASVPDAGQHIPGGKTAVPEMDEHLAAASMALLKALRQSWAATQQGLQEDHAVLQASVQQTHASASMAQALNQVLMHVAGLRERCQQMVAAADSKQACTLCSSAGKALEASIAELVKQVVALPDATTRAAVNGAADQLKLAWKAVQTAVLGDQGLHHVLAQARLQRSAVDALLVQYQVQAKEEPVSAPVLAALAAAADQQSVALQQTEASIHAGSRRVVWGSVLVGVFSLLIAMWMTRVFNRQLRSTAASLDSSIAFMRQASQQTVDLGSRVSGEMAKQAVSLEQTAAVVEELSATSSNNATSARDANELAHEARQLVSTGSGDARQAGVDAQESMAAFRHSITGIEEQAGNIRKFVEVIDEIAFQTNLLALNAAIEAARAGSAGAGFAVVAEEVRNLAQRSSEEANRSQQYVEEVLQSIGKMVKQSEQTGSSIVAAFDSRIIPTYERVDDRVQKLAHLIDDLQNTIGEQDKGLQQVNDAINQLDGAVQATNGLMHEGEQNNRLLNEQTDGLQLAIDQLHCLMHGGSTAVDDEAVEAAGEDDQHLALVHEERKALPHQAE